MYLGELIYKCKVNVTYCHLTTSEETITLSTKTRPRCLERTQLEMFANNYWMICLQMVLVEDFCAIDSFTNSQCYARYTCISCFKTSLSFAVSGPLTTQSPTFAVLSSATFAKSRSASDRFSSIKVWGSASAIVWIICSPPLLDVRSRFENSKTKSVIIRWSRVGNVRRRLLGPPVISGNRPAIDSQLSRPMSSQMLSVTDLVVWMTERST